jgi:hypothetical protein
MFRPCLFLDGHKQAIAGRITPGNFRNLTIESAINAPVFPHEIAIEAFFV